jgi:acyl carrier protein
MREAKVREILEQHGRLVIAIENLSNSDDLHNAGLTSLATVGLMLALEDQFDIEFPENMLTRKTFESIQSIVDSLNQLIDL